MTATSDKWLIVIGGPTASGKTALAIALARHYSTAILSADSRQFFREMQIGTARPDPQELGAAPHYFIADRSVEETYSAGAFARDALLLLDQLYRSTNVAVVVGGSGLYLRALTHGLDEFPEVSEEVRRRVQSLYEQEGLTGLQAAVAGTDPEYYLEVDRQNPARLRRALEVSWTAGRPFSSFRREAGDPRPFRCIYLYPDWPRELLYDRINRRVDRMIADGLEAEARGLYPLRHLRPLQTVGYQELFDHFDGAYDRDTAIELIKRNTRRYAKRQLTWLRRDGYWRPVAKGKADQALDYVSQMVGH